MKRSEKNQHLVKYIDSTDIPVCLFKNANAHKTMKGMKGLTSFGRNSKGTYFGLKTHFISDFRRKMLRVRFASANVDDQDLVIPMSKDLRGILIGDAGYIKKKLQSEFHKEGKRIFLAKLRKNMKILMTKFQQIPYDSRALIELNFGSLKMFHGLITSPPRSVDGYLANLYLVYWLIKSLNCQRMRENLFTIQKLSAKFKQFRFFQLSGFSL